MAMAREEDDVRNKFNSSINICCLCGHILLEMLSLWVVSSIFEAFKVYHV